MASVRKFDPERAKQAAELVDATWSEIAVKATEHIEDAITGPDGDRPWEERTVRDMYAAKVLELVGGERRAKVAAKAGAPVINAVVGIVARLPESAVDQWEAEMKAINAGQAPVLEAVVLEPEKK